MKKKNNIDLFGYNIPFLTVGVFVVVEWMSITTDCATPGIPQLMGNLKNSQNIVWFNFMDKKWIKRRDIPTSNDHYLTPGISIEVLH